jgi:shikimate dehydrogenase
VSTDERPPGGEPGSNVYLLGHPVAHSLSPAIQNAAFRALGLPHAYRAVDVEPDDLEGQVQGLRSDDCLGANVTVPYKLPVVPAMDAVDPEAEVLGAVNTIVNDGGHLVGYNTDVEGAWEGLLVPVRESIKDATVLILGAGGGARAVLMALARSLPEGPGEVVMIARRSEEGEVAAELGRGFKLNTRAGVGWELRDEIRTASMVVNCTPLGLYGEDPLEGLPLSGRVVLDLAYKRGGTPLFQRAWQEGSMALQGDQMLLHQGARAFRLWTRLEPPLQAMREALDSALT